MAASPAFLTATLSDLAVVGGGIIGLATARAYALAHPDARVVVVEKEDAIGQHQTGRNSGVVHAGLYYATGSLKARLCTDGRVRLAAYARERELPYDECGKVVVAVDDSEVEGLREIHRRATGNGVPDVEWLDTAGVRNVEPAVRAVAGVYSPHTAITDFAAVAAAYAEDLRRAGGEIVTRFEAAAIEQDAGSATLRTHDGRSVQATAVVTCAGLWSDRVAAMSGDVAEPWVVPFRGDYYALHPQARRLVRGLIYPVPDPRYPFLGVHLTRSVDGQVLVGPNAVLAGARDGYRLSKVRLRDLSDTVRAPGFRRMAARHWRTGARELYLSASRRAFAQEARRYVPALRARDLIRSRSGVRAQCVDADGDLLQDFCITTVGRVVNVRNAPSPAATSSLAIADEIVAMLEPLL
jgi:(S)-2-hydroxyglutarate dehydrogenase